MKSLFLFLVFLTTVSSMPCPSKCICKPMDMFDVDFTRMSYLMDCSNQSFPDGKFIYQAANWSINEDRKTDNEDNSIDDYIISIDLSKSLSIKTFTSQTIQLSGFSYSLESLHLTKQLPNFDLTSDAFDSQIYSQLKFLNLSTCCPRISDDCSSIFRPLKNLRTLDLSHSNMYKTCLNKPDSISSKLTDLILNSNHFDINMFSNTSRIFNGVRKLSGKLDFHHSTFQIRKSQEKTCLFNIFEEIKVLDLSSIKFDSNLTDIENQLSYLFQCQTSSNDEQMPGEQLLELSLRFLKLEKLPKWLNEQRFPLLRQLDLSHNQIHSIYLENFTYLDSIFLAHNPIEINQITWLADKIYKSINLHSTIVNRTYNLSRRLNNLMKLSSNIDYSNNQGNISVQLSQISVENDISSLNISRLNIQSFTGYYKNLKHLDISFNCLNELDLQQYPNLIYLDCSNQKLKKLSFSQDLNELNEFYCANNSLETIEYFSQLKHEQLKTIDLANNSIVFLEKLFSKLNSRYLRRINLQYNSIEIIQKNIFHQKLVSLYEINLSSNRIHTIQTEAFQAPNLQILDLRGNPLTNIEPRAILMQSLRLFYVFDDTDKLINRCLQSNSSDNFLALYINWFTSNGTLMETNVLPSNQCTNRYVIPTTINSILQTKKHFFTYYFIQFSLALGILGILIGVIYHYRKHQMKFFPQFRQYKKLDRQNLVENEFNLEDDFIVMNLKEPPYTPLTVISSNV